MWRLIVCVWFAASGLALDNLYSRLRLIALSPTHREWMNSTQVHELIHKGRRFRDVTDIQELPHGCSQTLSKFPTTVSQQAIVNPLLKQVSQEAPLAMLTNLTRFHNRYYNGDWGRQSSEFIYTLVRNMFPQVNVTRFQHRFPQASVIAQVEGHDNSKDIVVVSAHQDSINQQDPQNGRAPGADDDGSGTVAIFEALRVLATSSLKLQHTVEFHWYAGEEGGLLGSADIVQAYTSKSVVADLHLDMVGVPAQPPAVGIVTDYTDPDASKLVRALASAYTDLPTRDFQCGYACSDHASWHEAGVRSAIPFESQFIDYNTNIHSAQDTLNTVDFTHLLKYVRIALGFVVEVAGVHSS